MTRFWGYVINSQLWGNVKLECSIRPVLLSGGDTFVPYYRVMLTQGGQTFPLEDRIEHVFHSGLKTRVIRCCFPCLHTP